MYIYTSANKTVTLDFADQWVNSEDASSMIVEGPEDISGWTKAILCQLTKVMQKIIVSKATSSLLGSIDQQGDTLNTAYIFNFEKRSETSTLPWTNVELFAFVAIPPNSRKYCFIALYATVLQSYNYKLFLVLWDLVP